MDPFGVFLILFYLIMRPIKRNENTPFDFNSLPWALIEQYP